MFRLPTVPMVQRSPPSAPVTRRHFFCARRNFVVQASRLQFRPQTRSLFLRRPDNHAVPNGGAVDHDTCCRWGPWALLCCSRIVADFTEGDSHELQ